MLVRRTIYNMYITEGHPSPSSGFRREDTFQTSLLHASLPLLTFHADSKDYQALRPVFEKSLATLKILRYEQPAPLMLVTNNCPAANADSNGNCRYELDPNTNKLLVLNNRLSFSYK